MKRKVLIGDVVQIQGGLIDPRNNPDTFYELYSIPAFDANRTPQLVKGADIGSSKVVIPGRSVLFSKLNPRINRVWCVEDNTDTNRIASSEFVCLVPDETKLELAFLAWRLRVPWIVSELPKATAATKSRERIRPKTLLELPISLPSLSEQRNVVSVLDRLSNIGRLKLKVGERLREFTHALFLTLFGDPSINHMRWSTLPLGEIALITAGQSPPGNTYNENKIGLPFFQGKADFGDFHPIVRKWCTEPRRIANAGDILISVRAPVGPTNVAKERCCIGRGLAAIRPRETLTPLKFLLWTLHILEPTLLAKAQGSTFQAIGVNDLRNLMVPVPPLAESQRFTDILRIMEKVTGRVVESERIQTETAESLMYHLLGDR